MEKKHLLILRFPILDVIWLLIFAYLIFFGDKIHNYIGWCGLLFYAGCNNIAADIKSLKKEK